MKHFLVVVFVFLYAYSFAQDYVIMADGKTKKAEIKKPRFSYRLYHEIKIISDDEESTFSPYELKGYKYGEDEFETFDLGKNKSLYKFLKVVVRGYCTLYSYEYLDGMEYGVAPHPMQEPPMSKVYTGYYLKKEGEKIHAYNFAKLRKGQDKYFSDNSALKSDLQNRKYEKGDVKEIVERYNKERK